MESQYIENMYGYTDECGEYYMVDAVVGSVNKDGESLFSIVIDTRIHYSTTDELKTMNYHQAMKTFDKKHWQQAIRVEHGKMKKYNVFKTVHKKDVPEGTEVFDYAWDIKKNPSGVFRVRLEAIGFKQEEGKNYSNDNKSLPTYMSIAIIMVFTVLGNWSTKITDVEGAFLHGSFQKKN